MPKRALEFFLNKHLYCDEYQELFEEHLAESLQKDPEYRTDEDLTEDAAQSLAHRYVQDEPDAVDAVHRILDDADFDNALGGARLVKAKELAHDYMRRKPGAIEVVDKVLAREGSSIDAFMVRAMTNIMDNIDRIDRLAAIAETRRNATLREIHRRRVALGQALRQQVQEVEGEFEVIETTPAVTSVA